MSMWKTLYASALVVEFETVQGIVVGGISPLSYVSIRFWMVTWWSIRTHMCIYALFV